MNLRRKTLTTLLLLACAAASWAQEPPTLTYGQIETLKSATLGEERRLNVFLPAGYAASQDRYPVLYLLDGSAHEDYFHSAGLVDYLATYGVIEPTIVVGISNVDRKRDFTTPSDDELDRKAAPTAGGADKFVAFLEKELIPFVDGRFRTTPRRILFGQSLAGLMASKVLLEKPALFTDYLIVSPSLWWNKNALALQAEKSIAAWKVTPKIYLSIADEHPELRATGLALAGHLTAHAGKDEATKGSFRFDDLVDETHATAHHISLYRGLRFLLKKAP